MQTDRLCFPVIIILSFLVFWQKGIFQFLSAENLAGRDLIGNYAFTWLMHNFMQSFSVSGWSNLWFAGFPAFDFYPPLFFIAVSLLNFLSIGAVSLEMSYKIIIFLSLFIFPSVVFYSLRKMGFDSQESFFASVFSFGFLFLSGHYSAVHQTLNFGLVSQIFSLNLLMLFFGALFHDNRNYIIAGILLGLLALSHPFVALVGIFGWLIFLISDRHWKKNWKKTALIGLVGFAISSWWVANAFANADYMNTFISQSMPISDFPIIFIPFIIAGFKKSRKEVFIFSLFIINLAAGTSGLEFISQPTRFFQYSLLFGMLLAGLGGYRICEFIRNSFLKSETQKIFLAAIILVPFMFSIFQAPMHKEWESGISAGSLISKIKNLGEGRILAESGTGGKDYYALMERIPIETGKPVLTELHADSSLSAPYALALQYWISYDPVSNPICGLCGSKTKADDKVLLAGLEKFNVKYIVAGNEKTREFLDGLKEDMFMKEKTGNYYIFEAKYESRYYDIPKYKPILIISGLGKWKELNEKIFADDDLANLTFVRLDAIPDHAERFGQIFEMQKSETAEDFYERIKRDITPACGNYSAAIRDFSFSDKKISFSIDSESEAPVLLKFSYFPGWKGNGKIYLASPSLMLVFGKGKMEISY